MKFQVRRYQPEDEEQVLRLFRTVFGESKPREKWRWQHEDNPVAAPMVVVGLDDRQEIVAHNAFLPLAGQVRGKSYRFALGVDAMSHPRIRAAVMGRRGVFAETTRYLLEGRGGTPRADFFYGFPAPRHLRLGQLVLNYNALGPVRFFARPVKQVSWGRLRAIKHRLHVRPFRSFGRQADELWKRLAPQHPFATVRDTRYLNWRYRDAPNAARYRFLALTDLGGTWQGWIVLARMDDCARVVDMLLPRDLSSSADAMMEVAQQTALGFGCTRFEAWMPDCGPGLPLLERAGFKREPEPQGLSLAVQIHTPDFDFDEVSRHFYYQMGDSDMY